MSEKQQEKVFEILLVEDNPADVKLTEEALRDLNVNKKLHVTEDGVEALSFLHRDGKYANHSRPDIILLDLNLPKKDGREVLKGIKSDQNLKNIPVIVLTTSQSEYDIAQAYNLHANCYITKPVQFDDFFQIVKSIENFWFKTVKLPRD